MPRHNEPATLDIWSRIGKVSGRVAVLGVGNDLFGDDGIGVSIARELAARVRESADCLVLDAGTAPENFTGLLRRFRPDFVLLVDAGQLSDEPGSIAWLDLQQTDGPGGSTHTLPPSVLAQFLVEDLVCRVGLLCIQPAQLEFGCALSAPVRRAADEVVDRLARALAPASRSI